MVGLKAKRPSRICGVNHDGFVAKQVTKDFRAKVLGQRHVALEAGLLGPLGFGTLVSIPGVQGGQVQ